LLNSLVSAWGEALKQPTIAFAADMAPEECGKSKNAFFVTYFQEYNQHNHAIGFLHQKRSS
jgi:hypothetical protein